MEDQIVESASVGNVNVDIFYDPEPIDPRTEYENLATIGYTPNSRNCLGDKSMDVEEMKKIQANEKDYICLPVFVYEHSGICLNTTGFSCRWDSGQSGIIYVSKKKVREEWNVKRISPKLKELILRILVGEISTFSAYVSGECYGYKVNDNNGEEIESCYGYFDFDCCKEDAMSIAKAS